MAKGVITSVDASSVEAREQLRQQQRLTLVSAQQEGGSILDLPDGVFGFTYSPAIAAPLFSTFRYRTFEMHRHDGEAFIVGFVSDDDAKRLQSATDVDVTIFHDRIPEATHLASVPYAWITRHRQYSIHNTPGLELTLRPR